MKINLYSILPAHVRYNRTLSPQAVLLYGEIAASANAYGICDENNASFASLLAVDSRTITRLLGQLMESGHIQRIREQGKRRLKIVPGGLEVPIGVDIELDEIVPKEDISEFVLQFLTQWERAVNTVIDKKELYTPLIASRLGSFSKDQLLIALKNRANFVNASSWHKDPENRQAATSIDTLIRSDEALLKWLNMKVKEEPKPALHKFNK